jgi:hypothetical protein
VELTGQADPALPGTRVPLLDEHGRQKLGNFDRVDLGLAGDIVGAALLDPVVEER